MRLLRPALLAAAPAGCAVPPPGVFSFIDRSFYR